MTPQTSLKKEFSWILIGNLFYAAMQYVMLIGMVKLTNPTLVGQFSFGLAVNAPIALFMSMAIRAVLISDAQNRFLKSTYLRLRILTAFGTFAVSALFVMFSGQSGVTAKVILLIALIKALESISDLIYGFMQKYDKTHQIAKSLIYRGILSCVLANLFLYYTGQIEWLCIGWLLATAVILVIYDLPRIPKVKNVLVAPADLTLQTDVGLRSLFVLALPLGIATVLSSLEANTPRYFIEGSIGLSALGIFSALSYPLMLTNQVVGSLASAPSPRLALFFTQRNFTAFHQLLRRLVLISAGLSGLSFLVCVLIGKPLLTILNGPVYALENNTFLVLALAGVFNSVAIFYGAALSAMQCFYTKLVLQIASLATVAIAVAIGSTQKTLLAIAFALLAGSLVSLLAQIIAFKIECSRQGFGTSVNREVCP